MHIAIDCRLGGIAHAGIGRYITHIVQELIALSTPDVHWSIICRDAAQASEVLGKFQKHKSVAVVFVRARHYTIREQLELIPVLWRLKPDVFHVPHFNAPVFYFGKTVVTIHDLLWHEMRGSSVTTLPAWQYWLKYYFYKLITSIGISHASKVLVPTKAVSNTILSFYPNAKQKIQITKEGVSASFLSKKPATYSWTARSQAGLLYVGSLYPHKNVELVLKAVQRMSDTTLKIVGARSAFLPEVQALAAQLGIANRVEFTGALSDTELAKAYQTATALVQPSRSEGFGLTGIEAMASGTPVLCSNILVFREVYADNAFYFDPTSVDSFIATYSQLKQKKSASKIAAAYSYASTFSWKSTASETMSAYTQAAYA